MDYKKTVDKVEINKFMKKWYVIAGRTTFLEKGAHNSVEYYTWNKDEERIDIKFTFNKDSFDGDLKEIPQKGWIYNEETNAHWKISPFWPLKLNFLVIGLADDYSWTAIGVPNGKYLWVMADKPSMSDSKLAEILEGLEKSGYPINEVELVEHEDAVK